MQEELYRLLVRALRHLIEARNPQGHWGDVRSTALGSWALSEVIAHENAPLGALSDLPDALADSLTWLAGQAKREEGGVSWDSEAWDTALATIALLGSDAFSERLDQAVAWLHKNRCPRAGAWYDEVWETTLSSIAILRREARRRGPLFRDVSWLEGVLRWISSVPSKSSGEFICPHYSGFLCWLSAEIYQVEGLVSRLDSAVLNRFEEKVEAACGWLTDQAHFGGSQLWSEYTFANAYIVYGLASLEGIGRGRHFPLQPVVRWFAGQQGRHGGYEDTEDTAIAILALSLMADRVEGDPSLLQIVSLTLSSQPRVRQELFIGYCGASKAVALEIKDYLAKYLPGIVVHDWVWDFQLGQHLLAEINRISQRCRMAIFLVTRDDETSLPGGTLVSTPRDNVVFEVGFFCARLGMENTIIIVEDGVKLPTDWGGILYLPMANRRDLASVVMPLLRAIERQLAIPGKP